MKNVIGLDIGGTKITGIVWDGKKVVKELTIVTPKNLYEFWRDLLKLVDFLPVNKKITSIGLGMAGLVDAKKGIIKYSPNIKFAKNLNLVKFFKQNGFSNVLLDNDANCFTRAELVVAQGKKVKNFLALTLGTGIGGGIVLNREIYRGASGSGAEFGHIVMAGMFMEKQFQNFRDSKDFKSLGLLVGRGLASLANIFTPDAIIIGGSLGHNEAPKYLPWTKKEMQKFLFDKSTKPKIIISQLKNAGAIGAALLVK